MSTLTFEEPRSVTLPSLSTATLGTCSSTSVAVPPPAYVCSCPTFTTRLVELDTPPIERSALISTASIMVPVIFNLHLADVHVAVAVVEGHGVGVVPSVRNL
jgi:hypothetical protein